MGTAPKAGVAIAAAAPRGGCRRPTGVAARGAGCGVRAQLAARWRGTRVACAFGWVGGAPTRCGGCTLLLGGGGAGDLALQPQIGLTSGSLAGASSVGPQIVRQKPSREKAGRVRALDGGEMDELSALGVAATRAAAAGRPLLRCVSAWGRGVRCLGTGELRV